MTQEQRDSGKIISIIILILIILIGMLASSCSSQLYTNNKKINITHVLAVTEMGDTLKIPIEAIRPNVIYNVMGYNYMRPNYYFRPYNYTYDYYPYNYSNNNSINYSVPTKPTAPISVSSGTSGFSSKPPASNPVTNGGGKKKKN